MWKEHLGINVILENQEWKSFLAARSQGNFDLCRGDWVGDYNDPTTFLDLFRSDAAFNTTSWKNAHYDSLLNQALLVKDNDKRMHKLQEAEAYLLENAPIIPLFFLNWSALVHPNIQGWYDNVLDYHPYQAVLLKAVP
jgi:ABC-type oligopeptide transport system substrate-binding subunit